MANIDTDKVMKVAGVRQLISKIKSTFYTKPSNGIPKTDLDSSVQTSLGKADSALQSHQSLDGYVNGITEDSTTTFGDYTSIVVNKSGKNVLYRTAIELWKYIKGKADSVYATLTHYHSASEITSGKFADSMIESASNWNGKLDKSGGTMTGDIGFSSIGTWPTASGETYPIKSKGIYWAGSSDTAYIYYSVEDSDKGRLNLDMGDDSNVDIAFKFGSSSSKKVYTIDYNGNFSGNSATVNGHSVNSDVPANAKFTDTNTWRPVVDNLESSSSTDCLSANQGRILDIHDKVSVYLLRGSTYWGNSVTENDMFPLATLTQSGSGNWGIYDRFFMRVASTCWVRFAIVVNGTRNSISTKSVLVEESRGVSYSEILVTYNVVGNSSEGGASVKIYWKNANKKTWSKAFLWRIPSSSGDAGYNSYKVWTILDGNRITSLPEGETACSVVSSNATYRGNAETATTATNYSSTGGIATALAGKQGTLPIKDDVYDIGVTASVTSNKSFNDGDGNNIINTYMRITGNVEQNVNGNKNFQNNVVVVGSLTANSASLGGTGITGDLNVSGTIYGNVNNADMVDNLHFALNGGGASSHPAQTIDFF